MRPSHRPIEAIDQRIQLFGSNLIKASKIGHDTRAYLAAVVSKGFDQLKVLAAARFGDASKHVITITVKLPSVNSLMIHVCDDKNLMTSNSRSYNPLKTLDFTVEVTSE